ncbi:TBCC domain-containing protein 1-like protein, partial [Tanacetum coccineum]
MQCRLLRILWCLHWDINIEIVGGYHNATASTSAFAVATATPSAVVVNCHEYVIYVLAPLKYATMYGCSDATIVLGAVGK